MNNTELLYAIQTLKDILSRNNVMPEYLIFVDANSVLYLSFLDDTITNILKNLSADESFAESAVGPNAFSLALKNKSISKVVGEEHTYTSLKKYILCCSYYY